MPTATLEPTQADGARQSLQDLVLEYQRTRADATFAAIADKCRGIARYAARPIFRRYGWARANEDELLALGEVALWRAAITWRPDGGAGFVGWAIGGARNAMRGAAQRSCRHPTPISLDALVRDGDVPLYSLVADDHCDSPDVQADHREQVEALHDLIGRVCDTREAELICLRFREGWSLPRLGRRYGCSGEWARQGIKRAVAKVRRAAAVKR